MSAERTDFSWIPAATILLGEHGSRAAGTHTPDSDRDLTGICSEPRRFITGLQRFESHRFNSAGEDNKSGAEDTDTTVYGLRKWAALACAGSPNALLPLFMSKYEILTPAGHLLLENRSVFLSRCTITKHLGYLDSQRRVLLGLGGARKPRADLVERYGYDTKYAGSMIMAGIRGLSLTRDARISLPLSSDDRGLIGRVRGGFLNLDTVLGIAENLEQRIRSAEASSRLPERVDADAVDLVLDRVYEAAWAEAATRENSTPHPAFLAA